MRSDVGFHLMKSPAHIVCSVIIVLALSETGLRCARLERSVSPSQQFIIYGVNGALRGALSELAEQTKTNLLALLQQRDRWETPIVINLQPQQANLPEIPPTELRFSQTGSGLKLQLDLTITQNFDASLMERELLRAILLEMIYRKEPDIAAGTVFVEPPDWLLEGVLALAAERDRGPLVEALSLSDKWVSLEEFLRQRPGLLDSAGRLLYRAYSCALVKLLVDGPDGRSRLARYIGSLSHASNDPLADLKAQFPLMAGNAEKTWQSAITRLSGAQSYQLLTFAESERRLSELLRAKIPEIGKSVDLGALARQKASASEKVALNQLSQALLLFIGQANPVLRPVAREYQEIATRLARGKRKGVTKRLARLENTRERLASRMSDIDDYMNWFEATQMESRSGVFADYLRVADQPRAPEPRRRDPLSVYLDALQDQLEDYQQ
ncbi:MAG: hypothetical protein DME96_07105 [Verrucomicrobia bacterium]|nr:MAG: hypothetical protein DME96_07105 [Verrucomicrobiota bacterium]